MFGAGDGDGDGCRVARWQVKAKTNSTLVSIVWRKREQMLGQTVLMRHLVRRVWWVSAHGRCTLSVGGLVW